MAGGVHRGRDDLDVAASPGVGGKPEDPARRCAADDLAVGRDERDHDARWCRPRRGTPSSWWRCGPPLWGPTINTPGGLLSIRPPTGADQLWCPAESVTQRPQRHGTVGVPVGRPPDRDAGPQPQRAPRVPRGVPSTNSCTDDTPWSSADVDPRGRGCPLRKPAGASIEADGARSGGGGGGGAVAGGARARSAAAASTSPLATAPGGLIGTAVDSSADSVADAVRLGTAERSSAATPDDERSGRRGAAEAEQVVAAVGLDVAPRRGDVDPAAPVRLRCRSSGRCRSRPPTPRPGSSRGTSACRRRRCRRRRTRPRRVPWRRPRWRESRSESRRGWRGSC